ncbi:NrsF family protein [soil metagenome]
MKTDDLISALSADLPATGAAQLRARMATWLVPAAVLALAGVILSLGLRPDLAAAVAGPTFWAKAAYTAALAATGFWLLDRAGRPGASVRAPLILLAALLLVALLGGATSLMMTPVEGRAPALMGGSSRVCPTNIAGLSLLAAPLILFAARRFAPVRPILAGAAVGLLAGGLAATAYGLHCPEHTAAFVAVWYTLGMAIPVAVGALIGRFVWRW